MREKAVSRRWRPGSGRTSKPDSSSARASLGLRPSGRPHGRCSLAPGVLCWGFPGWSRVPTGRGGRGQHRNRDPSWLLPRACLASPVMEGKGIARGQLFTVKGLPFLAGLQVLVLAPGGGGRTGRPAPSSLAAETCAWGHLQMENSKLLWWGRGTAGSPGGIQSSLHICLSAETPTAAQLRRPMQLQFSSRNKHRY